MTFYVDFVLGLDLGPPAAYTALAIVEEPVWLRTDWARALHVSADGWVSPAGLTAAEVDQARRWAAEYGRPSKPPLHLRHLERFSPQTPYPRLVERCQALLDAAPLTQHATSLVLDATMVGTGVVDLFRHADMLRPVLVSITGGDHVHTDRDLCRVPRRDLVAAVQAVLQTERLKIAAGLTEAPTLTAELLTFQETRPAASATDVLWREGPRDDLVLATALAVWWRDWWSVHLDARAAELTTPRRSA